MEHVLSVVVQPLSMACFQTLVGPSLEQPGLYSWLNSSEQEGRLETTRGPFQAQLPWDPALWSYILLLVKVCAGISQFTAWVEDEICSLQQCWCYCDCTSHTSALNYRWCSCNMGIILFSCFPRAFATIMFSNYSHSKWCCTVSQQYSKCNTSICHCSNTDINFERKHRHILGNVLLNLIKLTKHQPADQIQRVLISWSLLSSIYIYASLCSTVLQKWTSFMY